MTRWEVTARLPMRLPSLANARMHWRQLAATKKAQRSYAALALRTTGRAFFAHWKVLRGNEAMRMRVVLTRSGPRALDSDNLQGAFKAVRDQVAEFLGLDDGSDRFDWVYLQARGLYEVTIHMQVLTEEKER